MSKRREISECCHELLPRIKKAQERVEEEYFPELKGKVRLIYMPDLFLGGISTNSNIFFYKPVINIGDIGLLQLVGTPESVTEGVLGHEYSHIADINKKGLYGIIKRAYRKLFYLKSNNFEKKLRYEMKTDLGTAGRGCGKQLLEFLEGVKDFYAQNNMVLDQDLALRQINPRIKNLEEYLRKWQK